MLSNEERFFQAIDPQKYIGKMAFEPPQSDIYLTEDKPNGQSAELDIVMHNGTYSLIIEVNDSCHRNDVDWFEEKMRKAYAYISKEFNNRKLLFGMAANTFSDDAIKRAHKHGMILFHPDGLRVRIDTSACALLHPNSSA